jgi:hypothetical protein
MSRLNGTYVCKELGAEFKVTESSDANGTGKGVSFKLSFEEAYQKALLDLLTKARKGGYMPPYIPLKFQIYKQHITPMIGTFPPHFALEVYLIAPWPQD